MVLVLAGCGSGGPAPETSAGPRDDKTLCGTSHTGPVDPTADQLAAIGQGAATEASNADLRQAGATLRDRAKAAQADPAALGAAQDALHDLQIVCIHLFGPNF